MNWYKESKQKRITQPYYRITTKALYGGSAEGEKVGPGTYWTPRWDAIIKMVQSTWRHAYLNRNLLPEEDFYMKIWQIDDAIMDDAPEEHGWATSYDHDAGEQVLVEAVSEPKVILEGLPRDPEIEPLIDQPTEKLINYSMGEKVIWNNKEVFMYPNYKNKSMDIAQKNEDGWSYSIIKEIRSMSELESFMSQVETSDHFDKDGMLSYFLMDMGWWDVQS